MRLLKTAAVVGVLYRLIVEGRLTVDTGWGRSLRPLGPLRSEISAPRETVFDVIALPYLERTPRAMAEKLKVIEQGTDMVLAAHRTPIRYGLVATTLETVRFTRPERIDFRLVRGPVPHVVEYFLLEEVDRVTRLLYAGELGADLWAIGRWWGDAVARRWEAAVAHSLQSIKVEAERRIHPS